MLHTGHARTSQSPSKPICLFFAFSLETKLPPFYKSVLAVEERGLCAPSIPVPAVSTEPPYLGGSQRPLTISKRRRTSFSDSPLYLEVRLEEDTLKKVVPHSVATALASSVLPVPGGPTISTPWANHHGDTSQIYKTWIYKQESCIKQAVNKIEY